MRFRGVVTRNGKTATGIEVPADVVEALGSGKRPKVRVTIGGYTYRSSVAPYTGIFMLPLAAVHREAAGVTAGDEVDVELEIDDAPRKVTVPPELATALDAEPKAKRFFDGLSYSQRRWFVESIEAATKPETRRRRIERAVERLREGRGQR